MSWYRTYRPQTIAGLHLTDVREQLLAMLASGNIPHALLSIGPRGTGKTSSARILAKVLNCEKQGQRSKASGSKKKKSSSKAYVEPCNTCDMCKAITQGSSLNVIEMDAASNRGIDDIRSLREKVYIPPAQGSHLVYIIDEVHMLTTEAFNALLKILEEPPEHAVFILATTEPHKVPETIQSRCTILHFHKASLQEIVESLSTIASQENIQTDDDILTRIAERSDGSFRDAVKLFEQIVNAFDKKEKLNAEKIEEFLGSVGKTSPRELVECILQKDEHKVVTFFQTLRSHTIDSVYFHKALLEYIHEELLKDVGVIQEKAAFEQKVSSYLLKQFSEVSVNPNLPMPLLPLELCALEMVIKSKRGRGSGGGSHYSSNKQKNEESKSNSKNSKKSKKKMNEGESENSFENKNLIVDQDDNEEKDESLKFTDQSNGVVATGDASFVDGKELHERWEQLLQTVRNNNISLGALLKSSKFVRGEQGKAWIQVFYPFHKEQLELERNRQVIESCVAEVLGGQLIIEYELSKKAQRQATSVHSNISGKVEDEELIKAAEEILL